MAVYYVSKLLMKEVGSKREVVDDKNTDDNTTEIHHFIMAGGPVRKGNQREKYLKLRYPKKIKKSLHNISVGYEGG